MNADDFQSLAHAVSHLPSLIERLEQLRGANEGDPQFIYWDAVAASRAGDYPRAKRLLARCIELAPNQSPPRYELGFVLQQQGDYAQAVPCFQAALQLNPQSQAAWINLGACLHQLQQYAPAVQSFQRALQLQSRELGAWFGCFAALEASERFAEAGQIGLQMRQLFGADAERDSRLTRCLMVAGDHAQARAFLQQLLRENPNNVQAQHLLGGVGGAEHRRANDGYVAQFFDAYAKTYDTHLSELAYAVPAAMRDLVLSQVTTGARALDLGCGTGLVGAALPELQWTGVDLSKHMLAQAKARGYQDLQQSEIESFLSNAQTASFELITAASVLVYFGDLSQVLSEAKRVLTPNGLICFDVETNNDIDGFQQAAHGRYGHATDYVRRELQTAGFDALVMNELNVRQHGKDAVPAILVLARSV
jgi:predicted TPR repeat methyltransferase